MQPIYVLFGVDMETDVGSFTPFYEGVQHGTPLLLDLFARKISEGLSSSPATVRGKIHGSRRW